MKKRVLLVDTNFSAEPIFESMVEAGYEVFVCGGNPQDFLAKSSKNYINIDYADIDKMRKLIQSLSFDHIVPGCNDRSYQVCAELQFCGSFSGLDSFETSEIINNKEKFRHFSSQTGVPVPRVISEDKLGDVWPIIVKPVDAYSGRGMTVVQEYDENILTIAIKKAESFSRTATCIIEEFVSGRLYSHSAFLSDGAITIDFIVEEHCTVNPFAVDTSRVVNNFPAEMLKNIRSCIINIARDLNLTDGLIHTQFIAGASKFWIIEITRRCPGDLYSQLIEYSSGFRYAEEYTKSFLKNKMSYPKTIIKSNYVLRHTISLPIEKIFKSLTFHAPLQIQKFIPLAVSGDLIKGSPFGRIGLLFTNALSEQHLSDLMDKTINRKIYSIN